MLFSTGRTRGSWTQTTGWCGWQRPTCGPGGAGAGAGEGAGADGAAGGGEARSAAAAGSTAAARRTPCRRRSLRSSCHPSCSS